MTIVSMIEEGYRFYRPSPMQNVDCSALRSLSDHARILGRVFDAVSLVRTNVELKPEDLAREWRRVQQWLEMAGGLQHVDVERTPSSDSTYFCNSAWEVQAANNSVASGYATEHVRLQYVWNAVERLLNLIDMPTVTPKRDNGRYNQACLLLTKNISVPLAHYECVLPHLRHHIQTDRGLATDARLQRSLTEQQGRGHFALLLAAGNQLRNIPAHGDVTIPEPVDRDEGSDRTLRPSLHAPRLGMRGLLFSFRC